MSQSNQENDSHPKESVNIFFKSNQDETRVMENASSSEKYIILQNEILQKENRALRNSIKNLKTLNSEMEDQIDSNDQSKRYIKGLLKNLVELEKLRAEVQSKNTKMRSETHTIVSSFKENSEKHIKYLKTFIFIFFCILWEFHLLNIKHFITILSPTLICLAFIINMNSKLQLPSFETELESISQTEEEIKKITDAQDFLSEHIDSL